MSDSPISKDDIYLGLKLNIPQIIEKYPDASTAAKAPFSGFIGLNVSPDILATGSLVAKNNTFLDDLYKNSADGATGTLVETGVGAVLDYSSYKYAGVTKSFIAKTVTNTTFTNVTVEQAIAQIYDNGTVKYYVSKSTGTLIKTDMALSETTHIPLGKFLAGAGHAMTAYSIYEALKNPVTDAYNATTGAGDKIDPIKSYTEASVGALAGGYAGGLATGFVIGLGVATGGAAIAGAGAGGGVGYLAYAVTKTVLDGLPEMIDGARAAGLSLENTQIKIHDFIVQKVNEVYSATGSKAQEILNDAGKYVDDLGKGLSDLDPVYV